MATPVITIKEFRDKWGILGLGLLVRRLIQLVPEATENTELASTIGEAIADLESALKEVE